MAKDEKLKEQISDLKTENKTLKEQAKMVPDLEKKIVDLTDKFDKSADELLSTKTELNDSKVKIADLEKGIKNFESERVKELEIANKNLISEKSLLEKKVGKVSGNFPAILSPPGGRIVSEVQMDEKTLKRAVVLETKERLQGGQLRLLLQMEIVNGECVKAEYSDLK
jgi:chromosome segregation ATPase